MTDTEHEEWLKDREVREKAGREKIEKEKALKHIQKDADTSDENKTRQETASEEDEDDDDEEEALID